MKFKPIPGVSLPRQQMVAEAARKVGATPAGIPGLWGVSGYPVLTTGQLLDIASKL